MSSVATDKPQPVKMARPFDTPLESDQTKSTALLCTLALAPTRVLDWDAPVKVITDGKVLTLQRHVHDGMTADISTRLGDVVTDANGKEEIRIPKDPDAPDHVVAFGNLLFSVALNDGENNLGNKRGVQDDEHYMSFLKKEAASNLQIKVRKVKGYGDKLLDCSSIEEFVKALSASAPSKARNQRIKIFVSLYTRIINRLVELGAPQELLQHVEAIQPKTESVPEPVAGTKHSAEETTDEISTQTKKRRTGGKSKAKK